MESRAIKTRGEHAPISRLDNYSTSFWFFIKFWVYLLPGKIFWAIGYIISPFFSKDIAQKLRWKLKLGLAILTIVLLWGKSSKLASSLFSSSPAAIPLAIRPLNLSVQKHATGSPMPSGSREKNVFELYLDWLGEDQKGGPKW